MRPNPCEDARNRCRRAWHAARRRDAATAALVDRCYAQVLAAAEDQSPDARADMFDRVAALFQILADMRAWPTQGRGRRSGNASPPSGVRRLPRALPF
jgi:hypothetical protein